MTSDAAGRSVEHAYDLAGRQTRTWGRDTAGYALGLRTLVEYGDQGDAAANRARNRLGQPVRMTGPAVTVFEGQIDVPDTL